MVFEVQQNSDATFRLYDWKHIDAKTKQPRELQVDQALACINYAQDVIGPVLPAVEATVPVLREKLFHSNQFSLWRHRGQSPFPVGAAGAPRILVCIDGAGQVEHGAASYAVRKGDVTLLPAAAGIWSFRPVAR